MAFDSIAQGGVPAPLSAMVSTGDMEEAVVGFYMGNQKDGEMTLGGADSNHYTGDLHYVSFQTKSDQ